MSNLMSEIKLKPREECGPIVKECQLSDVCPSYNKDLCPLAFQYLNKENKQPIPLSMCEVHSTLAMIYLNSGKDKRLFVQAAGAFDLYEIYKIYDEEGKIQENKLPLLVFILMENAAIVGSSLTKEEREFYSKSLELYLKKNPSWGRAL